MIRRKEGGSRAQEKNGSKTLSSANGPICTSCSGDLRPSYRHQFQFSDHLIESQTDGRRREQTYSFVNTEEVIGRDDDKKAIIKLLLETKSEEKIKFVPIVGIGGLGKTTVAQMVFNDEKVKSHFELRMWVCVSDTFEVQLVVEKMLEAATQSSIQQNSSLETLQNGLRNAIGGKRYLLVLDDVWNEDAEKWRMVKNLLGAGARGSSIVVTTRLELVGRITHTSTKHSYSLEGLSKDQSLCLFKQIAFEEEIPTSSHQDPAIETIGEKIVDRCAGVPLAIKAIGRVLRFKKSKSEWSHVLENVTRHVTRIEPILRLSYDHLRSHLKQCFAYCSLFPKDYRINRRDLINLWVAQGFIQSSNTDEALEDVGDDYFVDLLWRSFFQEVQEDEFGNIESCKMHDLMHDLAKSVAGIECALIDPIDVKNVDQNTCHLSLVKKIDSSWEIPDALLKSSKLRTFFLPFGGDLYESNIDAIVRSFRCLRMLGLNWSTFEKLPHSICKLKHLRCLDLSRNKRIKELPDCMTRLHNLQTLKLVSCSNLEELPRKIGDMVSLKHIELDGCKGMRHMARGIGQLTCLTTLDLFVVGLEDRKIGGLSELKSLNNLNGKLRIRSLKNVIPETGAAYLKEKTQLEYLDLRWAEYSDLGRDEYLDLIWGGDEMGLQSLQRHRVDMSANDEMVLQSL